ncbi:MAG: serine hydrolase domain-containing protein [Allobranchiibius sp.]
MSSGPAGMTFVDPQFDAGRRFLTVSAARPRPLAEQLRPLDVTVVGAGRSFTLAQFLSETHSTSLLVLEQGRVVHEWYPNGVTARSLLLGASMSKSVLAHLVGMAVRDGSLRLGDRVTDHVPELAGSGYNSVQVWQLLTMTSGVQWTEDYRDTRSVAMRLLVTFQGSGGRSRDVLSDIAPDDLPGSRYAYCTADSQVLDWVRERATGVFYEAAVAQLWAAMGCTQSAVVAADDAGVALAGGGLAATAQDWAKVGLLQVDGSTWWQEPARRVLNEEWVQASSRPSLPFLRPGRLPSSISTHVGFGYHWWPLDDGGKQVSADGSRGQFCFVDRAARTVVVKTSQWPYADSMADRQWRDLCYLALPDIAAQASALTRD